MDVLLFVTVLAALAFLYLTSQAASSVWVIVARLIARKLTYPFGGLNRRQATSRLSGVHSDGEPSRK